jgi:hypothetical protein
MIVYNREGESIDVVFRFAVPGDVPQIISLLKKQYGSGYYSVMYDEAYVKDLIETERLRVAVAELEDGALAGIIGANTENAFPGSIEFRMMLISPGMQNSGLGSRIHRFLLDSIPPGIYTSIYGRCVTLHTKTQHNCQTLGYRMTGLLLNELLNDREAENTSGISLPVKDSLLMVSIPQKKQDAGLLYVPPDHAGFIAGIYDDLGVAYTLGGGTSSQLQSVYAVHQTEEHHYCELMVRETGGDFEGIFDNILGKYIGLENQSFNIFINLTDPGCPRACSLLEDRGFFFTGLQPLAGPYEYLLMHYSPSLPVSFDRIAVVPEFKDRFDYIHQLYRRASCDKSN